MAAAPPPLVVDFLVAGGGPAGCAFATLAARAGASVALVERDDYAQRRPGEHLAGSVRPMLDRLRVPRALADGIAMPSPGILSAWNAGSSVLKMYGFVGQPPGLRVVRHRFDELLCRTARDAGAVVVRGRLVRLERHHGRAWTATIAAAERQRQEVTARSIVDATGRTAAVARMQGARRVNHGDLIAIVRWLEIISPPPRSAALLTIESGPGGWWSLSALQDRTLVATLYTSLSLMRAARTTPHDWWCEALDASERVGDAVRAHGAPAGPARVFRACPSRSTHLSGEGWIAIGDAGIALDPVAGHGVALALETACRAFEAAQADPSFVLLGKEYRDALLSRFHRHLDGRAEVYADAAAVLPPAFVHAVGAAAAR